jgi:hypothetical protein
VHEFTYILTCFYFKLSDLFRIYTDLHESVLNLFKNTLTATLPHTAAPLDSRILLRALLDSRILPRTLVRTLLHCLTQPCALPQTAAHCMHLNAGQPHTAHRILHTAHSRTPQLSRIKIIYVNVYEFMYIYVN